MGCPARFEQEPLHPFGQAAPEKVISGEGVSRNGEDEAWSEKMIEGDAGNVLSVAAEVKKCVAMGAGMETAAEGGEVEVRSLLHVEGDFQLRLPVARVDSR